MSRTKSKTPGMLFEQVTRVDPSPAGHGEDSFTFMNRVDQPLWARVREVLDAWFAEWPRGEATDLAARFQDADSRQHYPAWWELYLFTLYRRLGYSVRRSSERPAHLRASGFSDRPRERAGLRRGGGRELRHRGRRAAPRRSRRLDL